MITYKILNDDLTRLYSTFASFHILSCNYKLFPNIKIIKYLNALSDSLKINSQNQKEK